MTTEPTIGVVTDKYDVIQSDPPPRLRPRPTLADELEPLLAPFGIIREPGSIRFYRPLDGLDPER